MESRKEGGTADAVGKSKGAEAGPSAAAVATGPVTRLPDKIMGILLNEEAPEAIWWIHNGTAFVMQQEKFQAQILDTHFRGNKFKSLVRNLHRWYV